jgi:hypothetical protein
MKQIKSYPINHSPLYKLSNKTKLADILGIDKRYLLHFKYTRDNYKCWERPKKNDNGTRPVEDPKYELKKIQSKLNKLLSRIITSEYLMSGKKYSSYIVNAQYHKDNPYVFCFDLSKFFQKATRKYIFKAFVSEFKMSDDIAWLITDLVTIPNEDNSDGYIPTGSPSSQSVIYWAYKPLFDKILLIAEQKQLKFSLYVDDMTFSSDKSIRSDFPKTIEKMCAKVGLEINDTKTKYFGKGKYKDVTGCIITPSRELKVPNKRRKDLLDIIKNKPIEDMTVKEIRSVYGKLNSMRQIEPNIFPQIYNRVKKQYYKLGAQYSDKSMKSKGYK